MSNPNFRKSLLLILACLYNSFLFAQPNIELDLKKPKQFEERQLGSEKSAEKKFTFIRHFFQNTYTHYNYYFNANNILNDIIASAKMSNEEDYSELLPYYSWSLENTSTSGEIDSVLEKCTAGILLHDLRNDWIDNMYFLMGKAYYLRKDFDSAAMAFQYLNYAFAPKEKDGFDIPIGSNSQEGSNAFSILTKEKKNHIFKRPPSRNDGFIWQIRTLTDRGDLIDASSLIAILRNDPNFPKRLEPGLGEASGYLFYKLKQWDSAAVNLEKSIDLADDLEDKARRWYLVGQLYQLSGNNEMAAEAYSNCSKNAIDPVMDVYARLNTIRLRKKDNPELIEESIRSLESMARKDKYIDYRDIILYAAALFELERDGYANAENFLLKSLEVKNSQKQRSLTFMLLGDVRYDQKKYGLAFHPYDSVGPTDVKPPEAKKVESRIPGCSDIYEADQVITLQDSLLVIAAMPEPDRSNRVKEISKILKKQRGIKDDISSQNTGSFSPGKKEEVDLFASTGIWYFYEPAIRASGFNSFKEKWGSRPNEDNWRRSSALGMIGGKMPETISSVNGDPDNFSPEEAMAPEMEFDSTDVSFDNLFSRLPITDERKMKANELILNALFKKAEALHEKIEDYPEAIKVYEEILRRRDTGRLAGKSILALIHCYTQINDQAGIKRMQDLIKNQFPDIKYTDQLSDKDSAIINSTYQNIYDLFLEGKFDMALKERKNADSLLGNSYWSPQLLYLQSVYHIKSREDSLAIVQLKNIQSKFTDHPLSQKAGVMIDVLKRRKEIEDYLTKLEVTRETEDAIVRSSVTTSAPQNTLPQIQYQSKEDSIRNQEKFQKVQKDLEERNAAVAKQKLEDEKKQAAEKAEAEKIAEEKRLQEEKELAIRQQEEARLAQKELEDKQAAEKEKAEKELAEKQAEEKLKAEKELAEKQAKEKAEIEKEASNKEEAAKLLAEKQAKEKVEMEKALLEKQAQEKAKAEKELADKLASEKLAEEKRIQDKILAEKMAAEKLKADKAAAEKAAAERQKRIDDVNISQPVTPSPFKIIGTESQTVAIVLEKIDPAYVNEVSYALQNSSRRNFGEQSVQVNKKKIKDGLWLITLQSASFTTMQESYNYIKYIRPITQNELITWLDKSKYYFITISDSNLAEVEKLQDINLYRKILQEAVPNKF